MQLSRVLWVRDGATDLGQLPAAWRDRTIGLSALLAVGLDRGWLVALVWTVGAQAEGEINMLARFGIVFYWCSLAIAFVCWIAALIILMAIITGKLSDSGVWMAVIFFLAVGCISWLVGRAARYVLGDIDEA